MWFSTKVVDKNLPINQILLHVTLELLIHLVARLLSSVYSYTQQNKVSQKVHSSLCTIQTIQKQVNQKIHSLICIMQVMQNKVNYKIHISYAHAHARNTNRRLQISRKKALPLKTKEAQHSLLTKFRFLFQLMKQIKNRYSDSITSEYTQWLVS